MSFVRVADARELKEGRQKCVDVGSVGVVLLNHGGTIYAFEDRCTHDDAPICGGEVEDGCIVCPRHGARFDIKTGDALSLPATEAVETFEVRIENGGIEVNID